MTTAKSLVLVVGAGASKEAGLPIGSELKHQIASMLDIRFQIGSEQISGDRYITSALRMLVSSPDGRRGDINPHLHAGWMIRDAMPQAPSIDNFIDAHRGNQKVAECGKLAIARCILQAEAKSLMYVDRSDRDPKINFRGLEETWYNSFFQLLVQRCQLDELPQRFSKVAIITFNYDRCIEHYLHESLKNYYGIDDHAAATIMAFLAIYHPYGSLGPLPWAGKPNSVSFGSPPSPQQLQSIAGELKTFTEGIDQNHSDILGIRSTLENAQRVAFLGFAYNPQNIELLYGSTSLGFVKLVPVFGTALGLSPSDVKVVASELKTLGGYHPDYIHLRGGLTSVELFHEYSRSLALQ